MPSVEDNLGWARNEAWADHGEEWSSGFGDTRRLWWGFIMPRIARAVPCEAAVEIACGHGRCTRYLSSVVGSLTAVDLAQEILDASAAQLADLTNIRYVLTDGYTMPTVPDSATDLVFSWDSLVHAEADVLAAYVTEIGRVLRPGGRAFIHHSNLGAALAADPELPENRQHWRGRSAHAGIVRAAAEQVGLSCDAQELLPWGGVEMIDCISFLRRPTDGIPRVDGVTHEHAAFLQEAHNLSRIAGIYG